MILCDKNIKSGLSQINQKNNQSRVQSCGWLLVKSPPSPSLCDHHRGGGERGGGGGGRGQGLHWTGAALMRWTLVSGPPTLVTIAAVLVVFWKGACSNTSIIVDGVQLAIWICVAVGIVAEVVS